MTMLLLPGDEGFNDWLAIPPPNYNRQSQNLVVDTDTGMFKPVDSKDFVEYLYGGEYDLRLEQIGDSDSYYD